MIPKRLTHEDIIARAEAHGNPHRRWADRTTQEEWDREAEEKATRADILRRMERNERKRLSSKWGLAICVALVILAAAIYWFGSLWQVLGAALVVAAVIVLGWVMEYFGDSEERNP